MASMAANSHSYVCYGQKPEVVDYELLRTLRIAESVHGESALDG